MSTMTVDIPDSLRKRAQVLAQNDGISFDQFIATALAEKIAVLEAGDYLQARAARGSREKFDRVLAKVPAIEPEAMDRIPEPNS